ncbi:MAG: SOS response-associated peptidase [Kiritimatiellia bacterium]|nr:SOS response-associated peptidase [Kiritimatiellia bacterium]
MCGRYSLAVEPDRILKFAGVKTGSLSWKPEPRIFPGQLAPILRWASDGSPEVALLRWGLIPAWAATPPPRLLINARSETVAVRASFRGLTDRRRCLIPADGFFDWHKEGSRRRPYRIARADAGLLAFAGLWDRWQPAGEAPRETFVILTTRANGLIAPIHDRMPVILDDAGQVRWLQDEVPFGPLAEDLLKPCPDDRLRVDPIEESARRKGADATLALFPE